MVAWRNVGSVHQSFSTCAEVCYSCAALPFVKDFGNLVVHSHLMGRKQLMAQLILLSRLSQDRVCLLIKEGFAFLVHDTHVNDHRGSRYSFGAFHLIVVLINF